MKALVAMGACLRSVFSGGREHEARTLARDALTWREALVENQDHNEAFVEWLLRSPRHVQAWLEITAVDEELARLVGYPPLGAIVTAVPSAQGEKDVAGLADTPPATAGSGRRKTAFAAAAASVLLSALVAYELNVFGPSGPWESVSTAVGEYRIMGLSDGTTLHLNTQTQAQWRFTNHERSVRLLQGEALFEIGKDPRPFRVRLNDTLIEDVGTAFSVRLRDDKSIDVVVANGIVRVGSGEHGKDEGSFAARSTVSEFSAGEGATVRAGRVVAHTLSTEEIVASLAWTTGQLWFQGERLDSIVDEFNRYNSRRLVIDSPCMAEYRIGGRYFARDPDGFARAIQSMGGSRVRTFRSAHSGESIHLNGDCDGADLPAQHAR